MGEKYSETNPFAPIKKASLEEPDVYGAAEGTSDHEPWDVPDATPFGDPAPQRDNTGSPNAEWTTLEDEPTPHFSDVPSDSNEPLAADEDGTAKESQTPDADANDNADDEAVPTGSAKEVLDWVGDDKARAQKALDAEEAKGDDARKGLTRDLNAKLEN